MRVLIAHEAPAGGGGVESYLAAIMPALRSRGHQVAFLCADSRRGEGPTRLDDAAEVMSVADEGMAGAMTRVGRWSPDVCFSHNMGPLAVDEQLLATCPVVKMMHGYFGTCISGLKSHAFPAVRPCSRVLGAACLALYFPRRCGQLRPALMVDQFRWAARQQRLFTRYAQVVVASRHMAHEYARHGVDDGRLTVAPLFSTIAAAELVRTPPADPLVVFVGRMTDLKGGDILIRAAAGARAPGGRPLRLAFAGSGPAEASWRALARDRGVDAVFHGWVTGEARDRVLRSASLLAVPSLWPEPFGLVGVEAAAHGVPAVAFDVGGIGEWLRDDVSGVLVKEVGDPESLGRAMRLALEDERLARLGAGARQVAAELSLPAHLDTIERVLARAAGSARTAA